MLIPPILSVSPLVLPARGRPVDLEVRVSAPLSGTALPVILLSHGHGRSNHLSSLLGYSPLTNGLSARGFLVVQPTHLDSKSLTIGPEEPDAPLYWRSRARDMTRLLDAMDVLEASVPTLAGRVDRSRVAVVGHSLGGHTASVLLGARHRDPRDGSEVNLADPRIRAGVLLAAPGRGDVLSDFAAQHYGFFSSIDFSTMTTPALVLAGENDPSTHLTTAGAAWHLDPYLLAPGPMSLVVLPGAGHGLGGVSGYDVAETTDEDPARVAIVVDLIASYLRSTLYSGDPAWMRVRDHLPSGTRVESKEASTTGDITG